MNYSDNYNSGSKSGVQTNEKKKFCDLLFNLSVVI